MTNFSVIGHLYDAYFGIFNDNVWVSTQNGNMAIEFANSVGVRKLLSDYCANYKRDAIAKTNESCFVSVDDEPLVSIEGEIHGEWKCPRFIGKTIRVI